MTLKAWVTAALFAAVVAGGGYLYWQYQASAVLPENIATGNGRIEANQVDISTKIAGRVQKIEAREGDMVTINQVLAQMDTAELDAQLLKSRADVAQAKSAVAAAETVIVQRRSELTLAEHNLQRTAELVERGFGTREKLEVRMSAMDTAKATLDAAHASLTSARRSVEALEAEQIRIKTQIADCTLVSPVVGRVLYRLTEPGEVLAGGGRVLTILSLADVYMEIFLPAPQAHLVNVGSEARIKLDVVEFVIPASVSFISPQSQFTPKQVETRSERDKLMFRVKVRVPTMLVKENIERVKTGMRGVAYVRLDRGGAFEWPDFLQNFPPGVAESSAVVLAPTKE